MRKLVLPFVFLFLCFCAKAQKIAGKIVDNSGNPIEFATIILQTTDSAFVNSSYSDSLGLFNINSDIKPFRLIVQHMMYDICEGEFAREDVGIIKLTEKEHGLNEVVVAAERPLIRVVDGKVTYDMQQLMKGKAASNAYEALLQLPGLREQNDAITLAGASSLTIIINGKPSTMTSEQLIELLKNTPKERIEKAEVMYSAPPQYHVRGAAVNLVLQSSTSDIPHLQGQINAAYSQYHYADYSTGATLLYSTPKTSTDFMYTFTYQGKYDGLDLYSHHLYNGVMYDIEQHNSGSGRSPIHNIRLGNDYKIDENNKLSIVYTANIRPRQSATQLSEGTFSNSENTKKSDKPVQMHNIALNYSSGFGLSAGGDYTFFQSHTTQSYKEMMIGKEDAFEAQSKQDINRMSVYADQSHDLGSEWTLNYGTKFMYALDKSSQCYKSLTNKDLSDSDSDSRLKEYTYNLYGGFDKSFSEQLSLSASLTGEFYKHGGFSQWSLFPSLEATYVASPAHIVQLAVSSDKAYPNYWSMINSISYLNGYSEIHGNPDLRPSKDYSVQLSYIVKNKYVFTVYSSYVDDYFVQLPYQSPDRLALIYSTTNFDYLQKTGINAMLPFKIGSFVDSRFTLDAFYEKAKSSNFNNSSFNNHKLTFYAGLDNTINIPSLPNVKVELSGAYLSKKIQGPSQLSDIYKIDAGVKWIVAKGKAEIRLKANDIFNSWSPDSWNMKFDNQNLNMNLISDSRYVSFSVSYKFGGYKEKKREAVDTSRFAR